MAIAFATLALFVNAQPGVGTESPVTARWWLTTSDLSRRLAEQTALEFRAGSAAEAPATGAIVIDDSQKFQTILGLGSSLEHATCFNLSQMDPNQREETLEKLFNREAGIGINLARVCIGTPDFTGEPWYTYDDISAGETDPELNHFSIDKDRQYILPILKAARRHNPELLFFASPWSPPGWMKSTGDMVGGHLLAERHDAYARYLARFIQAYAAEGIPIHAITIQNEPGVDRSKDIARWRYPSCRWSGEQERDFIKLHLGPALVKAGLSTEIWTYDHNFNVTRTADGDDPGLDYPRTVLRDRDAAKFVRGVAFHGYAGKPEGMSIFREEFPETPIHFTEGSVFGLSGGRRLIDYLRHWASSYNGWVTMLDTSGKPNNGPFRASRTCVTLDRRTGQVVYHFDYYQYGHFFRFLRRGGRRIASTAGDSILSSIAVQNPNHEIALVIVHSGREARDVPVFWREWRLQLTLPARSIATITWKGQVE